MGIKRLIYALNYVLMIVASSIYGQESGFPDFEDDILMKEIDYQKEVKAIDDSLKTIKGEKLSQQLTLYGDDFRPVRIDVKDKKEKASFYFQPYGFDQHRLFAAHLMDDGIENWYFFQGGLKLWINANGDSIKTGAKGFNEEELIVLFKAKKARYQAENLSTLKVMHKEDKKELEAIEAYVEEVKQLSLKLDSYEADADHEFFTSIDDSPLEVYVDEQGLKRKTIEKENFNGDCGFGDSRSMHVVYYNEKEEPILTEEYTETSWEVDRKVLDGKYQGDVMKKVYYNTLDHVMMEEPLVIFPEDE